MTKFGSGDLPPAWKSGADGDQVPLRSGRNRCWFESVPSAKTAVLYISFGL